jgi:two-component system chemotaxis sensor kinase CheA
MTLDLEMAEIAKVFFQESREGLDVMESGLLGLGASTDSENINTIFRAAHSIKGGSATFGFAEVADFTHGVETLLDEMRNGVRPVTAEAIQTLLQACDCLREMIASTEAEQPLDKLRIATLNSDIRHILGEHANAEPSSASTAARGCAAAPAAYAATAAGAANEPAGWRVVFEPVADLLRLRNEPARMFAELRRLGAFAAHADASRLPPLDALDPESCYLSWNIDIDGPVPRAKLHEVFDWVDSGCRLEFTPKESSAPAAPAALPGAAQTSAQPHSAIAASPTALKGVSPAEAERTAPAAAPAQRSAVESGSIHQLGG